MAYVDDLLLDGTVTQDPNDADKVVFTVPLYIKKTAVNAGAFEAFAGQYGWKATVKDENGDDVPNPITVFEKCKLICWDFAREVFKAALMDAAKKQAQAEAETQINQLLS